MNSISNLSSSYSYYGMQDETSLGANSLSRGMQQPGAARRGGDFRSCGGSTGERVLRALDKMGLSPEMRSTAYKAIMSVLQQGGTQGLGEQKSVIPDVAKALESAGFGGRDGMTGSIMCALKDVLRGM
jgi:hypothetical protein